jgi:hypothetical protein
MAVIDGYYISTDRSPLWTFAKSDSHDDLDE